MEWFGVILMLVIFLGEIFFFLEVFGFFLKEVEKIEKKILLCLLCVF